MYECILDGTKLEEIEIINLYYYRYWTALGWLSGWRVRRDQVIPNLNKALGYNFHMFCFR